MRKMIFAALTVVLCISIGFMVAVLLPLTVCAAPTDGDRCTTDYVGTLVGSDGEYYYRGGEQTSIKYLKDGTTEAFRHDNYDGPRRHYLIMPDGQDSYYGYCIEQGVSFPDANRYTGVEWQSDPYLNSMPESVRNGIMLATLYGRQPNKTVPVSGCNNDDWYWATQIIIWEYQQKLRSSPTAIHGNGYVPANYFQSTLDGRPAEKCYNYILSAMDEHQKIPSFAAMKPGEAPMNMLKWDEEKSVWTLSLRDANQTSASIRYDNSNIKFSKNGDDYLFTASKKTAGTTLAVKRSIDLPSHDMLVWGSATGTQSIVTGTADPFTFYIRFRTENPGTIVIHKTSEDGNREGFVFQLTDPNGKIASYNTDNQGIIKVPLFPGEYQVTEAEPAQYRHPQDCSIQIKENETTTLQYVNVLKKGRIQIEKTVKDNMKGLSSHEMDAEFQIYHESYTDFDKAPEWQKDNITTNNQGIAITKELPLGKYVVSQTRAGDKIALSKDLSVEITADYQTVSMPVENVMQKGKIEILKADLNENPIPGAVFTLRASEDIYGVENILIHQRGELVCTLISGNDGLTTTDWLYPGKYNLEEIISPKGYYPPENPITPIELSTDDRFIETFTRRIVIHNEPVEHVPNTGDSISENNREILYALLLICLNGMILIAFVSKERKNTLR